MLFYGRKCGPVRTVYIRVGGDGGVRSNNAALPRSLGGLGEGGVMYQQKGGIARCDAKRTRNFRNSLLQIKTLNFLIHIFVDYPTFFSYFICKTVENYLIIRPLGG